MSQDQLTSNIRVESIEGVIHPDQKRRQLLLCSENWGLLCITVGTAFKFNVTFTKCNIKYQLMPIWGGLSVVLMPMVAIDQQVTFTKRFVDLTGWEYIQRHTPYFFHLTRNDQITDSEISHLSIQWKAEFKFVVFLVYTKQLELNPNKSYINLQMW